MVMELVALMGITVWLLSRFLALVTTRLEHGERVHVSLAGRDILNAKGGDIRLIPLGKEKTQAIEGSDTQRTDNPTLSWQTEERGLLK